MKKYTGSGKRRSLTEKNHAHAVNFLLAKCLKKRGNGDIMKNNLHCNLQFQEELL